MSCHLSAAFKGDGDECPSNDFIDHLIDMSHLLLAINSSANFVIYTWRGRQEASKQCIYSSRHVLEFEVAKVRSLPQLNCKQENANVHHDLCNMGRAF